MNECRNRRALVKRILMILLAAAACSTAVHAQSLEPPVVAISASRFALSPGEITLKRGEPVTLRLISTDRIHKFHSKELGFDVEIRADQPREVTLLPEKRGR